MIPEADARRAERAHYTLVRELYFDERLDVPGMSLLASRIEGAEWNHVALLDVDAADLDVKLAEAEAFFNARRRPAAVAVSPWSRPPGLDAALAERGFRQVYRHAWLFATAGLRDESPPPEAEIRPVASDADLAAFGTVFHGVYDPLDPGFLPAIAASTGRRTPSCEVVHYVATVGGEPAGTATALYGRGDLHGLSGLYNLTVLPRFEGLGLGTALTVRRVEEARARGHELVFLQTERRVVERWQLGHGFELGFVQRGWEKLSKGW